MWWGKGGTSDWLGLVLFGLKEEFIKQQMFMINHHMHVMEICKITKS